MIFYEKVTLESKIEQKRKYPGYNLRNEGLLN